MKKYLEAIKTGEAIDCDAEPEKLREYISKEISFLRDGFTDTDLDKCIDFYISKSREKGVRFYVDINYDLHKFICLNLNRFIKNIIKKEITTLRSEGENKGEK